MEKIQWNTNLTTSKRRVYLKSENGSLLHCKLCGRYFVDLTDKCIRGKCIDIKISFNALQRPNNI